MYIYIYIYIYRNYFTQIISYQYFYKVELNNIPGQLNFGHDEVIIIGYKIVFCLL